MLPCYLRGWEDWSTANDRPKHVGIETPELVLDLPFLPPGNISQFIYHIWSIPGARIHVGYLFYAENLVSYAILTHRLAVLFCWTRGAPYHCTSGVAKLFPVKLDPPKGETPHTIAQPALLAVLERRGANWLLLGEPPELL